MVQNISKIKNNKNISRNKTDLSPKYIYSLILTGKQYILVNREAKGKNIKYGLKQYKSSTTFYRKNVYSVVCKNKVYKKISCPKNMRKSNKNTIFAHKTPWRIAGSYFPRNVNKIRLLRTQILHLFYI